jgi:hypothetical protein
VARQVVVAQVAFLLKLLALCVESVTARVYAEPLRETEALILSPGATDVPGCALGA